MVMIKRVGSSNQPKSARTGFTIIELLIVIVIIGILATAVLVIYRGVQIRAQDIGRQDDLQKIEATLAQYASQHSGVYPATTTNPTANWRTVDVRTDVNYFNGSAQADWIPGVGSLAQSVPNVGAALGVNGNAGCYLSLCQ